MRFRNHAWYLYVQCLDQKLQPWTGSLFSQPMDQQDIHPYHEHWEHIISIGPVVEVTLWETETSRATYDRVPAGS